uniref:Uncharacterized protein n=1 Tax=Arundo donax TaxID=35708 RepID=A0A0A9CF78_ARUDO
MNLGIKIIPRYCSANFLQP